MNSPDQQKRRNSDDSPAGLSRAVAEIERQETIRRLREYRRQFWRAGDDQRARVCDAAISALGGGPPRQQHAVEAELF